MSFNKGNLMLQADTYLLSCATMEKDITTNISLEWAPKDLVPLFNYPIPYTI